jgi:hypothetical protein
MNSTTLPPLKPRSQKLFSGGGGGVVTNAGLNATIATTGIRNNGGGNGRASTSSTGIQVQQMYDNSSQQKAYYTSNGIVAGAGIGVAAGGLYNNATNMNASNGNLLNGAKSPSADSMQSNNNNNNNNNSTTNGNTKQTNSQSNLSMANQSGLNGQQPPRRIQPMTPETAMKNYMQKLTSFEHHEIFNYSDIFFIGQNAKKINAVIGGTNNNGYDDENGSYKPVQHDQIYYRFEVFIKHIKGKVSNSVQK